MNSSKIIYKINQSFKNDIENHLKKVDNDFDPKLSSYVNIEDYSSKLYLKSVRYELWSLNDLIGLIAGYIINEVYFISNLSLDKNFQGYGLMTELLQFCKVDLMNKNISVLKLEVFRSNIKAINFYEKLGFSLVDKSDDKKFTYQLFITN